MKVLQINSVCGRGSTGRIAADIHGVLKEQGHESIIAYGRGNAPEEYEAIKIGSNFDNYLHVAKTRLFDYHGFGSAKATEEFIKKVKQYNPDIIHLHNLHGYYINIEILFSYLKEANKPVIWTLHDCWSFTGHCSHFDYVGCKKWKDGCHNCPQKMEYPSSLIKDNSKESYNRKKELFTSINDMTIVTPSKWLESLVKESFLGGYPVKVINNGINLDVFTPTVSNFREKYNLKDKYIILGVASPWTERKGYDYFKELSYELSSDEIIVLVGVTEKQKKMLNKNMIGINRTDSVTELAEIYTAADVFVNPTLEDNFPTTNLEALACGTPVITFNTGGSIESIDDSCGRVADKGSVSGLRYEINKLKLNNLLSEDCVKRSKLYNKFHKSMDYFSVYLGDKK